MPAKKHDISASNFRDPLLKVLGQLTGFKPGVVINHEKTYTPVFQMLGITRDQYGMDGASNVPLTERWVQWCVTKLINDNLVKREGKGQWSLTPTGVTEAQNLIAQGSVTMTTANDTTQPSIPVAVAADLAQASLGQSILVGPNSSENLYHPDAYIRSLATADSPCLGAYTDRSPICSGCLVRGNCLNAMSALLSRLAAKLAVEDREEEAKRKLAEEAAARAAAKAQQPATAAVTPAPASPTPTPAASAGGLVITPEAQVSFCAAAMEAPCQYCGKDILVGTPSAWVRKLGADKKTSAMLHRDCYNKLSGGK